MTSEEISDTALIEALCAIIGATRASILDKATSYKNEAIRSRQSLHRLRVLADKFSDEYNISHGSR